MYGDDPRPTDCGLSGNLSSASQSASTAASASAVLPPSVGITPPRLALQADSADAQLLLKQLSIPASAMPQGNAMDDSQLITALGPHPAATVHW